MNINALLNEDKKFVIKSAVAMLWPEHQTLYPSVEERVKVFQLLFDSRFGEPAALLDEAAKLGCDAQEVEPNNVLCQSLWLSGGKGRSIASPPGSTALNPSQGLRMAEQNNTDEELERLQNRQAVLQFRKDLAEHEARLLSPRATPQQSDEWVSEQPAVSQRHESAMYKL